MLFERNEFMQSVERFIDVVCRPLAEANATSIYKLILILEGPIMRLFKDKLETVLDQYEEVTGGAIARRVDKIGHRTAMATVVPQLLMATAWINAKELLDGGKPEGWSTEAYNRIVGNVRKFEELAGTLTMEQCKESWAAAFTMTIISSAMMNGKSLVEALTSVENYEPDLLTSCSCDFASQFLPAPFAHEYIKADAAACAMQVMEPCTGNCDECENEHDDSESWKTTGRFEPKPELN